LAFKSAQDESYVCILFSKLVGFILCLERFLDNIDERGSPFLMHVLEKQQQRLKGLFERSVVNVALWMFSWTRTQYGDDRMSKYDPLRPSS
jgi:hypothetical protein